MSSAPTTVREIFQRSSAFDPTLKNDNKICIGVVSPTTQQVEVTDPTHVYYIRNLKNRVGSWFFGKWKESDTPGNRNSPPPIPSSSRGDLVLIPEEAAFLAFVLGCLEIRFPRAPLINRRSPRHSHPELLHPVVSVEDLFARCFTRPVNESIRLWFVYSHFLCQGYVVKQGTTFGVHYLLYNGSPESVHSEFGVWLLPSPVDGCEAVPWLHVKGLTRLMQGVSKTLVLCTEDGGHIHEVLCSTDDREETEH